MVGDVINNASNNFGLVLTFLVSSGITAGVMKLIQVNRNDTISSNDDIKKYISNELLKVRNDLNKAEAKIDILQKDLKEERRQHLKTQKKLVTLSNIIKKKCPDIIPQIEEINKSIDEDMYYINDNNEENNNFFDFLKKNTNLVALVCIVSLASFVFMISFIVFLLFLTSILT